MANCAFEEIILNRQFHYESFADKLDLAIDGVLARKGGMSVTSCAGRGMQSARNPRALLLAGHEPTMDPRIDWMAEGLTADFEVCELGACDDNSDGAGPEFRAVIRPPNTSSSRVPCPRLGCHTRYSRYGDPKFYGFSTSDAALYCSGTPGESSRAVNRRHWYDNRRFEPVSRGCSPLSPHELCASPGRAADRSL